MGWFTSKRAVAAGGVLALGLFASACGSSSTAASSPAATSGAKASTSSTSGTSGSSGYSSSGYGSSGSSGTSGASGTSSSTSGAAAVALTSVPKVGKVLVDSAGYTLYMFSLDTNHQPHCSGSCATAWPPLLSTGKPTAGSGVSASLLGTVKDADGKTQVTYNGWPLYTFSGDTKPGEATGQGLDAFGGKWAAVTSAGTAVGASTTSSSSSTGGGW